MRRALARWRWAGIGVIWDAADPDDTPGQATAEITTRPVSLTVVYVQAGAHLTIGGISIVPPVIQAVPQWDAITEGEVRDETVQEDRDAAPGPDAR